MTTRVYNYQIQSNRNTFEANFLSQVYIYSLCYYKKLNERLVLKFGLRYISAGETISALYKGLQL